MAETAPAREPEADEVSFNEEPYAGESYGEESGGETPSDEEETSGGETPSDEEETSGGEGPSDPEGYETTEYNPAAYRKNREKDQEEVGTTAYDQEFYRKRSEERKHRLAEAAGEERRGAADMGAEPDYVDCKGPLEYTGEYPWSWKCTRCGQVFQKHELPHKCVQLPEE